MSWDSFCTSPLLDFYALEDERDDWHPPRREWDEIPFAPLAPKKSEPCEPVQLGLLDEEAS